MTTTDPLEAARRDVVKWLAQWGIHNDAEIGGLLDALIAAATPRPAGVDERLAALEEAAREMVNAYRDIESDVINGRTDLAWKNLIRALRDLHPATPGPDSDPAHDWRTHSTSPHRHAVPGDKEPIWERPDPDSEESVTFHAGIHPFDPDSEKRT